VGGVLDIPRRLSAGCVEDVALPRQPFPAAMFQKATVLKASSPVIR
jgi:hypothetical protein